MASDLRHVCLALCALALPISCADGLPGLAPEALPAARPERVEGFLGPMAADVHPDRAWLWARAPGAGTLRFELLAPGSRELVHRASDDTDFTASVQVGPLAPGTRHRYAVHFEAEDGRTRAVRDGAFTTPPAPDRAAPVRVAFGGDLAGQNVCRDAARGFPVFDAVAAREPDLFVGLGDMIYADGVCEPTGRYGNAQIPGDFGPSRTLDDFRAHWRYAREAPSLSRLLATTAYAAVWDDHEVVDDFGPQHASAGDPPVDLLLPGLRAFLEYNPVATARPSARLYRALRLGRHLELLLLDTRQYRDANTRPDGPDKSMLGRAQRRWLLARLAVSDATWKVIVSSVPLSIPTGTEERRDGWADLGGPTGFESELRALLDAIGPEAAPRVVWITADVHFAEVLRHRPYAGDPSVLVHEIAAGPLQAGLFPRRTLDPSLRPEVLFFHGPESAESVTSFEEALRWFTFGELDVAADGTLRVRVVGVSGEVLFETRLPPLEEPG